MPLGESIATGLCQAPQNILSPLASSLYEPTRTPIPQHRCYNGNRVISYKIYSGAKFQAASNPAPNSLFRKILPATPCRSRFCPEPGISLPRNSIEARILAPRYLYFFEVYI